MNLIFRFVLCVDFEILKKKKILKILFKYIHACDHT